MDSLNKYSYGRKLLESQGWKSGKGLGRNESGISEAIKPTLKFDKAGVGHNQGDDFSFHWWDHVYKKAASNIVVEHSEDGVDLKQKEDQTDLISTKKWKHKKKKKKSSSPERKPLTYGVFMKSAVLTHEGEVPDKKEVPSSSEDDDDNHLFHHAEQDHVAFKACEGRTAHKGARHGLTANGKLKRLEAQEMGLMVPVAVNGSTPYLEENGLGLETSSESRSAKKRKKKRKQRSENSDLSLSEHNQVTMDQCTDSVESIGETSCKITENGLGSRTVDESNLTASIKKKKKRKREKGDIDSTSNERVRDQSLDSVDNHDESCHIPKSQEDYRNDITNGFQKVDTVKEPRKKKKKRKQEHRDSD